MNADHQRILDALLRQELFAFVQKAFGVVSPGETFIPNWHIEAICYALERVWRGEIKRLLIMVPPRSLKSICASVAFPAFLLGHNPTRKIITASYSADLAAKHAGDTRAIMKTQWYQRLFPETRIGDEKDTESNFMTSRRGCRYSTSVGGTLTGRGGDIIIIDDPVNPREALSEIARSRANEWYKNTVLSRLNNKTSDAIIIVMQRLHLDDLVGHVMDLDDWYHLPIPAIAQRNEIVLTGPGQFKCRLEGDLLDPVREPLHILDNLRASIGSYNFSAQYLQKPIPVDGEIVKLGWFKRYTTLPDNNRGLIVQSWDTASKAGELNDYSVCTTWLVDGSNYYLIDVVRTKLDFPALRKLVVQEATKWNAREIIIEDKGSGTQLLQQLRSEGRVDIPRPIAYTPTADKLVRLAAQSTRIEAGQVFLPADELKAPWLDPLLAEFAQFPQGRHDDQVDSVSQFLDWIEGFNRRKNGVQSRPMFYYDKRDRR